MLGGSVSVATTTNTIFYVRKDLGRLAVTTPMH
jgi:hypothetical protein